MVALYNLYENQKYIPSSATSERVYLVDRKLRKSNQGGSGQMAAQTKWREGDQMYGNVNVILFLLDLSTINIEQ